MPSTAQWHAELFEGEVYEVDGGRFKESNPAYNNTGHAYEITFGRETIFEHVPAGDASIPYAKVSLLKISDIEQRNA